MNKPAIINALCLSFLYIFTILTRLNLLGKNFDIIFIPILTAGLIAEMWFVIKNLIKK